MAKMPQSPRATKKRAAPPAATKPSADAMRFGEMPAGTGPAKAASIAAAAVWEKACRLSYIANYETLTSEYLLTEVQQAGQELFARLAGLSVRLRYQNAGGILADRYEQDVNINGRYGGSAAEVVYDFGWHILEPFIRAGTKADFEAMNSDFQAFRGGTPLADCQLQIDEIANWWLTIRRDVLAVGELDRDRVLRMLKREWVRSEEGKAAASVNPQSPIILPVGDSPTKADTFAKSLGITIDPVRRDVSRGDMKANFGRKGKPWELFALLLRVGQSGIARAELLKELYAELDESIADHHKSALDKVLKPVRIKAEFVSPRTLALIVY